MLSAADLLVLPALAASRTSGHTIACCAVGLSATLMRILPNDSGGRPPCCRLLRTTYMSETRHGLPGIAPWNRHAAAFSSVARLTAAVTAIYLLWCHADSSLWVAGSAGFVAELLSEEKGTLLTERLSPRLRSRSGHPHTGVSRRAFVCWQASWHWCLYYILYATAAPPPHRV